MAELLAEMQSKGENDDGDSYPSHVGRDEEVKPPPSAHGEAQQEEEEEGDIVTDDSDL